MLPSGLHYKVDMTTGEKWAKLLDDKDSGKSKALEVHASHSANNQNNDDETTGANEGKETGVKVTVADSIDK